MTDKRPSIADLLRALQQKSARPVLGDDVRADLQRLITQVPPGSLSPDGAVVLCEASEGLAEGDVTPRRWVGIDPGVGDSAAFVVLEERDGRYTIIDCGRLP